MVARGKRLPWNWRSRVEITRHDTPAVKDVRGRKDPRFDGSVKFKMTFKQGQTPKGFANWVGELNVCDKPPYFVEDSAINGYFLRRGLGTVLYLHALNELGSLSTYYHDASFSAQGLWRRLVQRLPSHRVDFFAGTLNVTKPGTLE